MYYQVTISYQIEDEKTGKVKTQKHKYLFESESVEEATLRANKYLNVDMRNGEVISVAKSTVGRVITPETEPQLYSK